MLLEIATNTAQLTWFQDRLDRYADAIEWAAREYVKDNVRELKKQAKKVRRTGELEAKIKADPPERVGQVTRVTTYSLARYSWFAQAKNNFYRKGTARAQTMLGKRLAAGFEELFGSPPPPRKPTRRK